MLITPLRLLASYAQAFVLAKEKIRKYNRMNWLFPACNLIGVIIFVVLLKMGVKGALISLLLSALVVALYAIITVISKQRIRLKLDFGIVGNIYKHGVIFALSFFIIKMNYRIDIFLMERLSTFRETGFYALGVNIAELVFQIPMALWVIVVTRAANATDQQAMTHTVLKLLRVAFLFAFAGSVALFFVAPYAVRWIYGDKFIPSIGVVQTILPGILFIVVFKVLNGHLSGIGKPYIAALCFIPSILLNIGLNIWWIPLYGAMGAVMATNITYTLGAIVLLFVYARRMKASFRDIFFFRKTDFNFIRTIQNRLKGIGDPKPSTSGPDKQKQYPKQFPET
jgi:O-antigen/teichoic acid export membrane protein